MKFTNILLVIFLPYVLGQEKHNVTETIDTWDDISLSFWKPSRDLSYAQNFTEFFDQIQEQSKYLPIPQNDQLSYLEGVEGVWYTLWTDVNVIPTPITIRYSPVTSFIDYWTISYTLCGDSWITVSSTYDWEETLENTVDKDGNYTCDGKMRQESFYLVQTRSVTITLVTNTSDTPCFAMIDRIETAVEILSTTTQKPNSTTTKRATISTASTGSTTPGSVTITTTPGGGGDGSSTLSANQFLLMVFFAVSILHSFK